MHTPKVIAVSVVLLTLAGCPKPTPQEVSQQQLASYAELRLTSQSHHEPLQAELSLVSAARGLPAQIDADRHITATATGQQKNLAGALKTAFTASQLKFTRERTDKLFAAGPVEWNPIVLEQAIALRATYDDSFQRAAQAFATPGARLRLPMSAGLGLDSTFADAALIYARFELIDAADALSRGDAERAVAAMSRAMHVAEVLGDEPHVAARLTAARVRRDALGTMQRFATSRCASLAHLQQLERLLARQLAGWPSDTDAWIGDRAQGLCLYEMIRDGQILSVLTEDELLEIRRGEGIEVFASAVAKNVDIDQWQYLRTTREWIELCESPYYERNGRMQRIERERQALLESPDYPIIADRLLLGGVAEAQRQQAADLALTRGWSLALAVACGASLPPPQRNPVSGEPYRISATGERVVVAHIDPADPELEIVILMPSSASTANRGRRSF